MKKRRIYMVDLGLIATANLSNLLIAALMLSRIFTNKQVDYYLGLIVVALVVPVALGALFNFTRNRQWWTFTLPLFLLLFGLTELLFDYILKIAFRESALLWPYLLIFYLGQMAMIGYAFLVKRLAGFITLGSYFICLLATWFSHGRAV